MAGSGVTTSNAARYHADAGEVAELRATLREMYAGSETLEGFRAALRRQGDLTAGGDRQDVGSRAISLGGVPAVRHEPPAVEDPERAIVYFHGGGFVAGSAASHRHLATRLAARARAQVVSVDYRLAPEHPYPAALTDAHAAVTALLGEVGRCAVVGDSAGGLLAARVAKAHRNVDALVLLSPWLRLARPAHAVADDGIVSEEGLRWAADLFLAGLSAASVDEELWSEPPSTLPPVLIHAADGEVLREDAEPFVDHVRSAGVEVEVGLGLGAPHAWHHYEPQLGVARAAVDDVAGFVRRAGERADG